MAEDQWKHRSQGMLCQTCMYYVAKVPEAGVAPLLGRCRRHAPTMGGWPVMFPSDWCGDHKLDQMAYLRAGLGPEKAVQVSHSGSFQQKA